MEVKKESKRVIRKRKYYAALQKNLDDFKNILIINVDNVGSNQMQQVRLALRGKATILMGKNTVIRRILREKAEENEKLAGLIPHIKGNMGFVFTNGSLMEVRKAIVSNKVPAAAKSGGLAPVDVFVAPGPTGLDPGQTSFFQALNIPTKISRGAIEILSQVHLIKAGDKVTASSVALLSKLNLKPFFYGITVQTVYEDGSIYNAFVLDMTTESLVEKLMVGVRQMAAISLNIGFPTLASIPHSLANAFKNLLAVAFELDWMFAEAKEIKGEDSEEESDEEEEDEEEEDEEEEDEEEDEE